MASCAVDKIAYRVEHQSDLRGITKIEVEVTPWRPFAEIEVSFADDNPHTAEAAPIRVTGTQGAWLIPDDGVSQAGQRFVGETEPASAGATSAKLVFQLEDLHIEGTGAFHFWGEGSLHTVAGISCTGGAAPGLRVDVSDGMDYSKEEFVAFYGGTAELAGGHRQPTVEIARLVGSDEDDADEALESRDAEHEAWRRARRRARLADPRASPEPAPLRSYPFSCGCLAGQAVRRGPGAREGESEVSLGISVVSGGQSDAGPGSTASTPPSRSSQEQRSSRLGEQEHADKKRGDKRGDKERLVKALAAESMLRAMAAPPRAKASRPQRCDDPRSDGRPGATLDSPSSDSSSSDSPSDRPLDESYMATRLAQSMAESDVSAPSARPSRSLDLDSAPAAAALSTSMMSLGGRRL
ncbi:hypothetical protein EMIHUDRAFT_459352 [Emiliania huxleyi CCMP1516]|uniref:C2 NT-type domain-containing protein n=2 Tax=Emiliania huxleyi TaxID=2903 RepID=A0A0D3IVA8_EMIH1|nr:hypothetical protein EMIHUDRAFT_459352 [Emiliania huxleyi CCMP1516]EOD15193.1 hypothetical protein EMIHUDRAFT_459352 [Emiliania huxleyi CCMP1516]|eukprot:XP_005767622.1 hypothetical protein EMIHUDRAFT_459352 [Emiliania huxleyi CCMP1516]